MNYKQLEDSYIQRTCYSHREKFAQFFTPLKIAKLMSNWLVIKRSNQKILDPAFGLGVFYEFIKNDADSVIGYDIDDKITDYFFKNKKPNPNLTIKTINYLDSDDIKYNGIICNPPYLRFHHYDNGRSIAYINKKLSINLSKTSNLYTLFLVKSLSQLAFGGRLAYIVPIEFLNADYGVEIKKYLLSSGQLRHIAIFDPKSSLFNDALTTSCILLCANDSYNKQECSFSFIKKEEDLKLLENFYKFYPSHNMFKYKIRYSKLDPKIKWQHYYTSNKADCCNNLVPFSKYAKVTRGIATGSNEYFVFNKSKSKRNNITIESLSPCICRSKDIISPFFTIDTFNNLLESDKPVFLFNAQKTNEFKYSTLEYIKIGENLGVNKRYLTSSRKPWYSIEKRKPAPIWAGVFNRSGLKFIRNEANILNLTNFHCVYSDYEDVDLLFAYLSSNVAKSIFNDNKRVYGNGLNKFEPNDLNRALMLDIDLLSKDIKNSILQLYYKYRDESISGNTNNSYIEKIDKILEDNFM